MPRPRLIWILAVAGATLAAISSPGFPAATHSITLTAAGEPGAPMIVRGRILDRDGRTPLRATRVQVWQTDTRGLYDPDGGPEPRIKGELVTGARGEYELRTIRPAAYPNRDIPAHIHYRVFHRGGEQEFELRFDDDPLVGAAERARSRREGRAGVVQKVAARAGGMLEVEKDVRLR